MKLNKIAWFCICFAALTVLAFCPDKQPFLEIYVNGKLLDKDALTMKIGDNIRLKIHNESVAKYRFDSVVLFFIPDVGGQGGYLEGKEPEIKKVINTVGFEKMPNINVDYSSIMPQKGRLLGYKYTRLIVRLMKISKRVGSSIFKADDIVLNEYSFYNPRVRMEMDYEDGKGPHRTNAH